MAWRQIFHIVCSNLPKTTLDIAKLCVPPDFLPQPSNFLHGYIRHIRDISQLWVHIRHNTYLLTYCFQHKCLHPKNFGPFHYCGWGLHYWVKRYFFTVDPWWRKGERGEIVFDILVALLQLQYFLVRRNVTKKIGNFVTTSIAWEHL